MVLYDDDPSDSCRDTGSGTGSLGSYSSTGCTTLSSTYKNRTAYAVIKPTDSCRTEVSTVYFYGDDSCTGEVTSHTIDCTGTDYVDFNCGDFSGITGADETNSIYISW